MINNILRFLESRTFIISFGLISLTVVTLLLTLLPVEYIAQNKIFSYDKAGHLLIFGSWTLLLGLYRIFNKQSKPSLWTIPLWGVLFGIFIEVMQYLLPVNRNADLVDVGYDLAGCLLAYGLLRFFLGRYLSAD